MSNKNVTDFISNLEHPLKKEFLELRKVILENVPELDEHIKWKAPSYQINDTYFLTFKLFPPKNIQLVFHRGAKVLELPKDKLIKDNFGLLKWATNDRAIATFNSMDDVENLKNELIETINKWIKAIQLQ